MEPGSVEYFYILIIHFTIFTHFVFVDLVTLIQAIICICYKLHSLLHWGSFLLNNIRWSHYEESYVLFRHHYTTHTYTHVSVKTRTYTDTLYCYAEVRLWWSRSVPWENYQQGASVPARKWTCVRLWTKTAVTVKKWKCPLSKFPILNTRLKTPLDRMFRRKI